MKYILALSVLVAVVLVSGCITGNVPGAPDGEKPTPPKPELPAPGERVEFDGVVESMPSEYNGDWEISGRTVVVSEQTELEADYGGFRVGACVEVDGYVTGTKVAAKEIETERCSDLSEPEIPEEEITEEESEETSDESELNETGNETEESSEEPFSLEDLFGY